MAATIGPGFLCPIPGMALKACVSSRRRGRSGLSLGLVSLRVPDRDDHAGAREGPDDIERSWQFRAIVTCRSVPRAAATNRSMTAAVG